MSEGKPVVFIRPNDVLFSYDLIIIDIYNQYRYLMQLDDINIFKTLIESAFNENLYLYTIKYNDNDDMYFVDDITLNPVKIEDYDRIIISKKHSLITEKAWKWLLESGYAEIMFRVNISFFNHSIMDIEDGFDLFVLTHDAVYPESYYTGRFFKNKNKISEKIIDINKLANWFRDILSDNDDGILNTTWISDRVNDPQAIMYACIEYGHLEEFYSNRIMLDSNLVVLNESNMNEAKKLAEQEVLIGNIGVINPFKINTLNQLYNE